MRVDGTMGYYGSIATQMSYRNNRVNFEESLKANSISNDSGSVKTNQDYFKELCGHFPDVAFMVIDWAPDDEGGTDFSSEYEYAGICDTTNFGDPKKKSIMIPSSMIQKMADPAEKRKVYDWISMASNNYSRLAGTSEPGMKTAFMYLKENKDGSYGYGMCHSSVDKLDSLINYSKNIDDSKFDPRAMLFKKIKRYAEDVYNEVMDDVLKEKREGINEDAA